VLRLCQTSGLVPGRWPAPVLWRPALRRSRRRAQRAGWRAHVPPGGGGRGVCQTSGLVPRRWPAPVLWRPALRRRRRRAQRPGWRAHVQPGGGGRAVWQRPLEQREVAGAGVPFRGRWPAGLGAGQMGARKRFAALPANLPESRAGGGAAAAAAAPAHSARRQRGRGPGRASPVMPRSWPWQRGWAAAAAAAAATVAAAVARWRSNRRRQNAVRAARRRMGPSRSA